MNDDTQGQMSLGSMLLIDFFCVYLIVFFLCVYLIIIFL